MAIAFIGGGNMAGAIIGGLIARNHAAKDLLVIDPSQSARDRCKQTYGVATAPALTTPLAAGSQCVLAVKPQQMQIVCESIATMVTETTVLSIAAGTRMSSLSSWLGGHRNLIRVMPNTPALVGMGAAGMFADDSVTATERDAAQEIMTAVGLAIWVDKEDDIDSVTAISGSGPAYVFRWMELLQQSAQAIGLPAKTANALVLQTVRGAAELALQSDLPLSQLREQVTSPGGTTAAGLEAMNSAGIAQSIDAAAQAAHARSIELGKS